jgi:hypothetical protein
MQAFTGKRQVITHIARVPQVVRSLLKEVPL